MRRQSRCSDRERIRSTRDYSDAARSSSLPAERTSIAKTIVSEVDSGIVVTNELVDQHVPRTERELTMKVSWTIGWTSSTRAKSPSPDHSPRDNWRHELGS